MGSVLMRGRGVRAGGALAFSSLFSGADAPGKMPQACPPAPVLAGQHGFDEIQIYEVIKALIIWHHPHVIGFILDEY